MRNVKLLFSSLTVAFSILALTKALPYHIAMPLIFVCLSSSMFITAKEYASKKQTKSALWFLLLGIVLLAVTAYNVLSSLWGL